MPETTSVPHTVATGVACQGGKILVKGNAGSDIGIYMNGGEMVINGDVDVHLRTHAEGGKIIVKGNAQSKVGGQMVEGEIYDLRHDRRDDAWFQVCR